jgi:hypothetical protein
MQELIVIAGAACSEASETPDTGERLLNELLLGLSACGASAGNARSTATPLLRPLIRQHGL